MGLKELVSQICSMMLELLQSVPSDWRLEHFYRSEDGLTDEFFLDCHIDFNPNNPSGHVVR